jgi:type I restriction enzyme S subunit
MVGEPLPDTWRWSTLGQVAAPGIRAIVSGPFGSNIGSRFFVHSGVPVIRGNNLTTDMRRFIEDGFVFVSEEKANELGNCDAIVDDLVFTAAGSLGQVGLIPKEAKYPRYIISNKQLRARLDRTSVDPLFAYYWFASPEMVEYIQQRNTGSSVPLINLSVLKSLPLPLPPVSEQRAIAHIFGTLDEKIQLNRRMNTTLEAMTRTLFKSWFIDFGPVRAKAEGRDPGLPQPLADLFPDSFEDSGLGEIPRGWEVGTLGDVAEHPRRGVQPSRITPDTPYIALEHMPRRSIALTDWGFADGLESNKFEFRRGEVLFGKLRPYFHKVGVAPVDGVCSTDMVVVTPRTPQWFAFVLGLVSSDEFVEHTNAGSTGTKMPRTSWPEMARYAIALPPESVAGALTEWLQRSVERIIAGIHESRTLAAVRDALLPKLISGELRVRDADKFIGRVA